MRIGIISDIHSNLEALEAALEDIKTQNVEIVYCTGDLVGYAANPNEVIDLLRKDSVNCIMGNHDYACFNQRIRAEMNRDARDAIDYTKRVLTSENLLFLKELPWQIRENGIYLIHGLPPAHLDEYIHKQNKDELKQAFSSFCEQVAFVGHTHLFEIYQMTRNGEIRGPGFRQNKFKLESRSRYMIGAGSIGQPREDNRDAGYLIYDTNLRQIARRTFLYNVELTIEKIKNVGLPLDNGRRLLNGF